MQDMDSMTDMKRTKAEKKASEVTMEPREEEYPRGLRLHLGEEELAKLGLEKLAVGSEMMLEGCVKVTACEESQYEGGEMHRSCQLQLTKMALSTMPSGRKPTEEVLYGGK